MRHELVHRLTHVGHQHLAESLPGRGVIRRAGEIARPALHAAVALAFVAVSTLAVQLAAIAAGTAVPAHPLAVWTGVLVATATAPVLAVRLAVGLADRA